MGMYLAIGAIVAYIVLALFIARCCHLNSRLDAAVDRMFQPTTPSEPTNRHPHHEEAA